MPVDEAAAPVWRWCKDRVHLRRQPSRRRVPVPGRSGALAGALRARLQERAVVDLAFYQGGADDLRLGEEFHHNGLSVRCAQISRVPGAWPPRGAGNGWRPRP